MGPEIFDEIGFEKADESRWRELVEKGLKGASFEDTLVSYSDDGIAYGPIEAPMPDTVPIGRCQPAEPWSIVQRVDDSDAARAATQLGADLEGGAGAIALCLRGAPASYGFGIEADALPALLEQCAGHAVRFETAADGLAVILDAIAKADCGTLSLGLDVVSFPDEALASDQLARPATDLGARTVFRADGRLAHNAGASESQELAFMLAALAETMRFAETESLDLPMVLAKTELTLAADQNQFLTIAKLRAARLVYARFAEACNVEAATPHLHVETSFRMLTARDFENNILRNTIAVFAAGVADADSIAVLPHTLSHGLPDRFARRIARNTQTILIDESHLAHVVDPSAGAGSMEKLTDGLCEKAWALFQEIEAEGGIRKSLASGAFDARLAETAQSRREAIRTGRQKIIGTTVYPPDKERPIAVLAERQSGMAATMPLAPRPLHEGLGEGDAA